MTKLYDAILEHLSMLPLVNEAFSFFSFLAELWSATDFKETIENLIDKIPLSFRIFGPHLRCV